MSRDCPFLDDWEDSCHNICYLLQYSRMDPLRFHGLVNIQLMQLVSHHFSHCKWKATDPILVFLQLKGHGIPRSITIIKNRVKNLIDYLSFFLICVSQITIFKQHWFDVFFISLLAINIFLKSPPCYLKQHWPVSTLTDTGPFVPSLCMNQPQICTLPANLTSWDHRIIFLCFWP